MLHGLITIWLNNYYVAHVLVQFNDYYSVCVMRLKYTIIIIYYLTKADNDNN